MAALEIHHPSNALGAEVHGVDLRVLDDDAFAKIRAAFLEHGVLFFRDQELTPEDHIAFAERWGEIVVNRFFQAVDGYPQIAEVRKEPDQTLNIGGGWHTDHSYDVDPALGSILYAREVPASGGDTLFASMGAAYDALSDALKEVLGGLRARHSSRHVFGEQSVAYKATGGRIGNPERATQDAEHPVVIAHPDTGRKLLYVNPGFTTGIVGFKPEESAALLRFLYRHAAKPEFQVRFHWRKGSLAMWDNRSTWHYALNDYHGQRRLLHRITLAGAPLG